MNNTSSADVINEEITRQEVDADRRLAMLPKYFPELYLRAEALIYNWMGRLCLSYNGGYWHMYELSSGAFYMAPQTEERFETLCPGFGEAVDLSADAAGLVACLYAINQLANQTEADHYIEFYHRLRDYAFEHAEASKIFRAID
ncbi:MAG: antirestriction protein [Desulfobacteraceae bacterium]|nr:antirestriction protein [Desulfobacteraceae bacterium]